MLSKKKGIQVLPILNVLVILFFINVCIEVAN